MREKRGERNEENKNKEEEPSLWVFSLQYLQDTPESLK